jgi:hypothetical protein
MPLVAVKGAYDRGMIGGIGGDGGETTMRKLLTHSCYREFARLPSTPPLLNSTKSNGVRETPFFILLLAEFRIRSISHLAAVALPRWH